MVLVCEVNVKNECSLRKDLSFFSVKNNIYGSNKDETEKRVRDNKEI